MKFVNCFRSNTAGCADYGFKCQSNVGWTYNLGDMVHCIKCEMTPVGSIDQVINRDI